MNHVMRPVTVIAMLALAAALTGCGGEGGGGTPLTATTISSSTTASHSHTVEIPMTDLSASPANSVYQYRSADSGGHSHVIALSSAQITDIYNGSQVVVTSSSPNTGTDHTHTWTIMGGSVLYEKFCYTCHGNGKRNNSPMNVSFNASQSNAVRNPSAQPLSSASAPTPDPNYYPPTTPTPLTGKQIYDSICAACHKLGTYDASGSPDLSGKGSLVSGKFATSHNGNTLTSQQITDVAAFLNSN